MEHLHHKNARVTALKTGQVEFYTQATEEIEAEIRKLAEEDRELKEKAGRITKVERLGVDHRSDGIVRNKRLPAL
ncbi:hypothetical protein Barb6XT_02775 [Bacteroidales bacterium Barb6XT]|nr:hypothetical protein Barb6XT_02775 [Bacteroidales bacterium Barb6XT]